MEEKKLTLEETVKIIEEALKNKEVHFVRDNNNPLIWKLPIKSEDTELEAELEFDPNISYFRLSLLMGDLPMQPKEQWAFYLRLLQMNYRDTYEGRFAIDSKRNALVFLFFLDVQTVFENIGNLLNIIEYVYRELRPEVLDFLN